MKRNGGKKREMKHLVVGFQLINNFLDAFNYLFKQAFNFIKFKINLGFKFYVEKFLNIKYIKTIYCASKEEHTPITNM